MGHKVHPKIHRTQVIYTWDSRWFGKKKYAKYSEQDIRIREFLMKNLTKEEIEERTKRSQEADEKRIADNAHVYEYQIKHDREIAKREGRDRRVTRDMRF